MQTLAVKRVMDRKHRNRKIAETWKKPSLTRKEKFKKFLIYVLPLLLLVFIILVLSSIYYAVEKGCQTNFLCKTPDFEVTDNLDQSISVHLTKSQTEELKNNYTHLLPTLDYWESLHFIVITITTIGYGDVVPCTVEGQVVALVSAIIGMPCMVFALARLGQTFGLLLHKLWRLTYLHMFKPPYSEHRQKQLTNENYVPLSAGICITLFYIMICSLYFYMTLQSTYTADGKTFTFVNAMYFTMISFLTIGFGEYAPIRYQLIWSNMILLTIGLSMVALCIRLFQSNMEDIIDDIVDKIDENYTEDGEIKQKGWLSDSSQAAAKHATDGEPHHAGVVTKVLMASMGQNQARRLAKMYEGKLKFVTSDTQTDTDSCDFQAQVVSEQKSFSISYSDVACQVESDEDSNERFDNFEFIVSKNSLKRKSRLHVRQSIHPKRLKRYY